MLPLSLPLIKEARVMAGRGWNKYNQKEMQPVGNVFKRFSKISPESSVYLADWKRRCKRHLGHSVCLLNVPLWPLHLSLPSSIIGRCFLSTISPSPPPSLKVQQISFFPSSP